MGSPNAAVRKRRVKSSAILPLPSLCRSILNFQIGGDSELMPKEIIMAMAVIKKAAARVNSQLNGLDPEISKAIQLAADEVRDRERRKMNY